MIPSPTPGQDPRQRLQDRLQPVRTLLQKHRLVAVLMDRNRHNRRQVLVQQLVHRQQLAELRRTLARLHAADIAHLLETLPPHARPGVFACLSPPMGGEVLGELDDPIAGDLMAATDPELLLAAGKGLDGDDLQRLAPHFPQLVRDALFKALDAGQRRFVEYAAAYPEDRVGRLMTADAVAVAANDSIRQVIKTLRRRAPFPEHTDQLFAVDPSGRLLGVVALQALLTHPARQAVATTMVPPPLTLSPWDTLDAAAEVFERYDLRSCPVVDAKGQLLGRITVEAIVDHIRAAGQEDILQRDGLPGDVDLLAPAWQSARGRWLWLLVNLITAFVASRFIGLFEDTIERLVALATLMPIVASLGGNTGNQTTALFIRGLALDQINAANRGYLIAKELKVGFINGGLWGGLIGLGALVLYGDGPLALVMGLAVWLNLVIAAFAGIAIPLTMDRLGRDPALGASVLLTFTTDSMGFLLFLGLATAVLTP
ncbi:MAG: magnesium transporter [Candidatus Competibacterales bacterium]